MDKNNLKNVSFWIGFVCSIVILVQVILSYFNINIETKIFIDVISYVLSILVITGVLKSNSKAKNLDEMKDEIKNEIENNINEKDTK